MTRLLPTSKKAALFGVFLALFTVAVPAMANLSITPTIVVMEGRDRYADVYLVNPTDTLTNYEINWRFFEMEPVTGNYKAIDKSTTGWDLTKHIVFTPRRVAIEPQVAQKIRLGLRLGGEPPAPGDYRAHLELMKIPEPVAIKPGEPVKPGEKAKASVGVSVNVGFSIPVIYRVGESDATAKIGNVTSSIDRDSGKIKVSVPITKSKSTLGIAGDLSIYYKDEIVGQIKNANIFAEITDRTFNVLLTPEKLSGGSLRIVYKDFSRTKNTIYDEKTISVGQ